ncbi:hypothetical protein D5F11_011040 [Siminovitchia terrae]|uniref:Uncharacterized protein n=1 Tax=Siminovitchia terrae TaxID=1914933 RepID=A0A429X8E1_SIMTE|nr:hypothetical protein [Siminovitchia terrae]RST59636.1 hypothetical protein D5F11_011040 [Siminovitchia terrae]
MNAYWHSIQWGFKPRLNKVKASGGCHRFSEEFIERSSINSGRKYVKAHLMTAKRHWIKSNWTWWQKNCLFAIRLVHVS